MIRPWSASLHIKYYSTVSQCHIIKLPLSILSSTLDKKNRNCKQALATEGGISGNFLAHVLVQRKTEKWAAGSITITLRIS